jgi:hypothetical protein
MNSKVIGTETSWFFQLRAMVPAGFFQLFEFVQKVVGLFTLQAIVQRTVAQFGWEGLPICKTESIPDTFKGRLPTIEQIEAELEGERG